MNYGPTYNAGVEDFMSFCLIAGLILAKHESKLHGQFVVDFGDLARPPRIKSGVAPLQCRIISSFEKESAASL